MPLNVDKLSTGSLVVNGTEITPSAPPSYKVYTALLTQSGGDSNESIMNSPLLVGRTYRIANDGPPSGDWDFTNVGAPNNDFGTYFVATGTIPNNWGTNISLTYNTGAPVVTTVLENTIGNIWWTFVDNGTYSINSSGLFTQGKTTVSSPIYLLTNYTESPNFPVYLFLNYMDNNNVTLKSLQNNGSNLWFETNSVIGNNLGNYTPIEIRVYN